MHCGEWIYNSPSLFLFCYNINTISFMLTGFRENSVWVKVIQRKSTAYNKHNVFYNIWQDGHVCASFKLFYLEPLSQWAKFGNVICEPLFIGWRQGRERRMGGILECILLFALMGGSLKIPYFRKLLNSPICCFKSFSKIIKLQAPRF